MNRRSLIFFIRSHDAKAVKTRLARSIGRLKAGCLYRCFVEDLLETMDRGDYEPIIFFDPPEAEQTVRLWLGEGRSYMPQTGNDLGERMMLAFEWCFAEGFDKAILIGSDVPDLPAEHIEMAFHALSDRDAVIGPAMDGGYYLIGFNKDTFLAEAFYGPQWGGDSVCAETCRIMDKHNRSLSVLPAFRDIDDDRDLESLLREHRHSPFALSRTMQYILSWDR
ncbi:MAG: Phosphoenolpyruvate guanylyltransferase [Syntrophus sp. SKADARSKE-3]|nr:Phosphoenolpyruvate guanylyltransferase [Syntrophus sp. SKADARSKE-3]